MEWMKNLMILLTHHGSHLSGERRRRGGWGVKKMKYINIKKKVSQLFPLADERRVLSPVCDSTSLWGGGSSCFLLFGLQVPCFQSDLFDFFLVTCEQPEVTGRPTAACCYLGGLLRWESSVITGGLHRHSGFKNRGGDLTRGVHSTGGTRVYFFGFHRRVFRVVWTEQTCSSPGCSHSLCSSAQPQVRGFDS